MTDRQNNCNKIKMQIFPKKYAANKPCSHNKNKAREINNNKISHTNLLFLTPRKKIHLNL